MLGYGIVGLAIIVGVGTIVLQKFGDGVADCSSYDVDGDSVAPHYNISGQICQNSTQDTLGTPANNGWVNTNYLNTQLGTSGLAGWTPAIVAFSVGMVFLGAFLIKKGRQY